MDFLKVTDTGLVIASRKEIYDQLCIFARSAYGNDISLDEGSPLNAYLQMLADSLSTVNGAVQSFSELFSTKELSGNYLDFVAGRRGIVRKTKTNQRVIMTCTVDEHVIRPFLASKNIIYVRDNSQVDFQNDDQGSDGNWYNTDTGKMTSRIWVNTTQLMIQKNKFSPDGSFDTKENFQGTCEFGLMPLDGYDAKLLYANHSQSPDFSLLENLEVVAPSDPEFMEHFTFINKVNATPAVSEVENDAQLRARYDQAVYSNAASTVEGVRSNLLKSANYVRIVQNLTDSSDVDVDKNPYGLEAHSIWCIVDGTSTAPNYDGTDETVSNYSPDITIAQTILNYKSLGCGVSVSPQVVNGGEEGARTGNFMCEFPIETIVAQIPFTRLVNNKVTFEIVLRTTSSDGALRDTICEKVSFALQEYISTLQPGEVVTLSETVSAINSVLDKYPNGEFDFISSVPSYAIGTGILIYQRAEGGNANVTFDDGD